MYEADFEDLEFEPFEKFKKASKKGEKTAKKNDYQIRTARKTREKAKQAALDELESTSERQLPIDAEGPGSTFKK